jgi:hypothetical protein
LNKGEIKMALIGNEAKIVSVSQLPLVLQLDVAGNPARWITYEDSAYYYSKDRVAWAMGQVELTIFGGTNAESGQRSTLTMNTILAIKGDVTERQQRALYGTPPLTNRALFRRDANMCAYCGDVFAISKLTRDHVHPRSKGGKDRWENVVASCGPCNKKKDNRDIMELLYFPYAPSRAEFLILQNRRILADQQEFLMKRVPKESRLHS